MIGGAVRFVAKVSRNAGPFGAGFDQPRSQREQPTKRERSKRSQWRRVVTCVGSLRATLSMSASARGRDRVHKLVAASICGEAWEVWSMGYEQHALSVNCATEAPVACHRPRWYSLPQPPRAPRSGRLQGEIELTSL